MKWRIVETGVRVMLFMLAIATTLSMPAPSRAHEVRPAIADITVTPGSVELVIVMPIEPLVAGMSLDELADTNDSPLADRHDRLRALPPDELAAAFRKAWPEISAALRLQAGETPLAPEITSLDVPPVDNTALPRDSRLTLRATLPPDGTPVSLTWGRGLGLLALRQTGDEDAYAALLAPGETSAALPRVGTVEQSFLDTFSAYVVLGIEHIVPKGLDHILFVLALFLASTRVRPLLLQISAFTVAHTATLGLTAAGVIAPAGSVVEPLIALTIAWAAAENLIFKEMQAWRPLLAFGFGLIHGMGFAGAFGALGLPQEIFWPALIGFNVGVEVGQLSVIGMALAVSLPVRGILARAGRKQLYRPLIVLPVSLLIGVAGLWWAVERAFLQG